MSDDQPVQLVAIQLAIDGDAVDGADRYGTHLDGALDRALAEATAAAPEVGHRLAVLPEDTGHFAALALAPARARRAATVDGALGLAIAARPWRIAAGLVRTRGRNLRQAALAGLVPEAAAWFDERMAAAARRLGVWLVAGSHLRLRDDGKVTNSSILYDPDGRARALTDKINLVPYVEDERGLDLGRGAPDRLPVTATPFGRVATLICYDGFAEAHTAGERFVEVGPLADRAGARILVNPAGNLWPWRLGWIHAEPGESVLRCDQWQREGLPRTLAGLGQAGWGVTAHLVGRVLDQRFEGCSEILRRDGDTVTVVARAPHHDRGAVVMATVPPGATSSS